MTIKLYSLIMPRGRLKGDVDRDCSIRVPVSDEELERAHELAHRARMTIAGWVRSLMDREARTARLTTKTTKKGSRR